MWVSRKEWAELLKRVEAIENAAFVRVPDPENPRYLWGVPCTHYEKLPVADAVFMLAQNLGLRFLYKKQKSDFALNVLKKTK